MKNLLALLISLIATSASYAQSVKTWYDETIHNQLQAMEQGKIDFTPREYYRVLHGKPEALNLWLGDNYAVYDHKFVSIFYGWTYKFNANKSKAQNVFPYRLAYTAADSLTAAKILTMRDTLLNQVERETARALDCELDLYYPAYKDLFDEYDKDITDNLAKYMINCATFDNLRYTPGDKMGIKKNTLLELEKIRELVVNTHNAYMESTLKEEMYSDILEKYKKLAWMVSLNEKATRPFAQDPSIYIY